MTSQSYREQYMPSLMPTGKQQYFFPGTALPLAGGKLYTYAAGTSNPKVTYQDAAGAAPNTNPVVLDSTGSALIFWDGAYKIVLKDALGNVVYTVDNYNTDPLGVAQFIANLAKNTGAAIVGWARSVGGALNTTIGKWLGWHTPIIFEFMTDDQIAGVLAGNGIDVTAAVQAAMSGANGAIFPAGTYLCGTLNATGDFTFYGAARKSKLLHKANATDSLVKSLADNTVVFRDMDVDGNYANQTAAVGSYNMLWNAIGSMQFFNCRVHDSKGHLFRSGNIDNYDSTKFAHDVVIEGSDFVNPTASSGDCVRVERTRGYRVRNSTSYGGYSGFRTQLFCRDVDFTNVKSDYAYADCGITVAESWRVRVFNCEGSYNFQHGGEFDANVNIRTGGNSWHHNQKSGRFVTELGAADYANDPRYAGSIAEGFGANYSNQGYGSPRVSNLDAVFGDDVSYANGHADRFIGQNSSVLCADSTFSGNNTGGAYSGQVSIEGGTTNQTGVRIVRPTFVPNPTDTVCIQQSNYQFDGYVTAANIIGNKRLASYAANGMRDLNNTNRYLTDPSKRSALLADVADAASATGSAVSATTTGDSTYVFSGVFGSAQGEKMVRFVARTTANQAGYVAVNLFDKAGAYVATVQGESQINLTAAYQEFLFRVPAAAGNGCELRPQLRIPVAGVTIFMQEMNVFTSAA